MFSTAEQILDVPSEFQIGNVNVHLDEHAEALGQYGLDTIFWLGAIWFVSSAIRLGVTTAVGRIAAREV